MKVKKRGLGISIAMILIVILWYHCMYVFPYPAFLESILKQSNLIIFIALFGILSTLYCFKYYKRILKKYENWLNKYLLIVAISFALIFAYSLVKYWAQGIAETLRFSARYLVPFLVPSFLVLFERDGGAKKVFNHINYIIFVWYVIVIIQALYYGVNGHFLFDFRKFFFGDIHTRVYGVRIHMSAFGNVMIPYNFSRLYDKNNRSKWFNIVQIILGLYCIIFIQQTRAWILIIGISIACQLLCGKKSINRKIIQFVIVAAVFTILYATDFLPNLFNTFTGIDISEGNASVNNRIYAITYYLSCFKRNVLFGNGFAWCDKGSPFFAIEHGPLGIAYYSDVGLVGLLGQTGLCAIPFFIMPMVNIAKNLKTIWKRDKGRTESQFALSLFIYLIASSATLIVTETTLCLLFPLAIAYFAYESIERTI